MRTVHAVRQSFTDATPFRPPGAAPRGRRAVPGPLRRRVGRALERMLPEDRARPPGIELDASQAPELFAIIERLGDALESPPFHHILVTGELNAGAVQNRRFGVPGWHCNYLVVGLPLMMVLTPAQFEAVLAHEFGHLVTGFGRQRSGFAQSRRVMARPILRENEFEADRTSVQMTSANAVAEALTTVCIVGRYLDEHFGDDVGAMAEDGGDLSPLELLVQRVPLQMASATALDWLDEALSRGTDPLDTHPSLSERLHAIGRGPRIQPPAPEQGADRLLGPSLPGLTACFDRRWRERFLGA